MIHQEIKKSGNGDSFGDRALSSQIIDSAIEVHKSLGPGFLESFYEEALSLELADRKIPFERQKVVGISYKGSLVGEHRLDLLVDNRQVVELKTVSELEKVHFSIVPSYMKAVGVDSGMILNFATMTIAVKRVGPHAPSVPDFLIS